MASKNGVWRGAQPPSICKRNALMMFQKAGFLSLSLSLSFFLGSFFGGRFSWFFLAKSPLPLHRNWCIFLVFPMKASIPSIFS